MATNLPQREEYLRKKRKRKLIKWGIITFLLIFIFALLSYIAHRPEIRISKITLSGGVLVKEDDVKLESLKFISGKYLWTFPKNNAFLYQKKNLENHLKEVFKRVDTIEIKRDKFQTLIINITERKPVALWCEGLVDQVVELKKTTPEDLISEEGATERNVTDWEGGNTEDTSPNVRPTGKEEVVSSAERICYFIDQNSTIFAAAPNFSGDAYFKYYGLLASSSPIGNNYMASSTDFQNISNFVDRIKNLSLKPLYLVAKEKNEFSITINGGGEIYFDTKESLSKVADNLESLLRTPELSILDRKNLPVEYIDLRFGNKLFYKMKEPLVD